MNQSVATFRGVLESFNIGSQMEQVVNNLKQVSTQQNHHANEQVGHISQISSSMKQLSSSARIINENANRVVIAAQTTLQQVQNVSDATTEVSLTVAELQAVVDEAGVGVEKAKDDFTYLIERLNEVDEQSQSIEVIIRILNEIAAETHLLSLNASIEAAGAGQYGERFAIVASQVKELATRSSKASENVNELIVNTRNNIQSMRREAHARQQTFGTLVDLGSRVDTVVKQVLVRVNSSLDSANAILDAAQESTSQSNQIKAATSEQQTASEQILSTIKDLSYVVNIGAESSNEVAVTSNQLDDISRSLTSRLAELKLPVALAA